MADHAGYAHLGIFEVVRPKPVVTVLGHGLEDAERNLSSLPFAYQQPHGTSLRDGAGGELVTQALEPALGRFVMYMVGHQQSDQDVGALTWIERASRY